MASRNRSHNRYREMESIMTKVLIGDGLAFLLYMFAASRVGSWTVIKGIAAFLAIAISVLGLVWLYLTKPTLNGWRRDVSSYEESDDGMKAAEKNTDGSETQIVFTRKEKPRCLSCNFQKGKISGTFTALLLGGGDSTSVECTLDVNGLGLFAKPAKLLEAHFDMLHKTLGA